MAGEMDPKAAEELAKSAQHLKEAADATTRSFNEQLRIITQMRDAMNKMTQSMSEMGSSSPGGLSPETLREVTEELEEGTSAMDDQASVAKKLSEIMNGKLFKGFAVVGSLLTGLKQGFSNIVALGKGVFNLFMSVADGLWEVTKAVVAIPFKMMQGLFKMANQGGGDTAYAQALENIRKEYGSLQSDSAMAIKTAARDLRTLDLGGISTYRIFGNAAQQLEAVTKMAQGMGASFQVFGDEVMKNGAAMAAYNKGLGITDEMMSGIASNAMRMGKGITDIQNDMTKQALGMSKAFGVNAKVISRDMGKAMQDLAHFGHLSTNELAIAATFANKLGVSVDKLTGIMDATSTYDQAAEGMSKLNEQYGTNIDATEIMSAQNPAEKLEILRKEFAKTGKDMSSLTYQDRMLIKQTSGLSDELMDAAFSAKNANVNLSDIQKQGAKNERKTLSQAEAMSKLADSMERIVQSGQGVGGGIFAHFMDGMKRGLMASPEFMKLMNNIRHVFRIATEAGVKLGRMFVDLFPGVKDIFGGMGKLFEPKRWRSMFAEVTKALDVFRIGGSGKIEDFMDRVKSAFSKFFAGGKDGSQQVVEGFKAFGKAIFSSIIMIAEWSWKKLKSLYADFVKELKDPGDTARAIMDSIVSASNTLSNWIKTAFIPFTKNAIEAITGWLKGDELKKAAPSASGIMSYLGEVFGPLGSALKKMWVELSGPLKELGVTIVVKLMDALESAWDSLPTSKKFMFIAAKFGPSLISSMTSLIPLIVKSWPSIIQGLSVLFPTVASWFSGGFIAALTSGVTSVITFITGGSLFAGMALALVGAFVAVVGSAFAGIKLGNMWANSIREGYKEGVDKIGKDSNKFFEDLKEVTNPEERVKLITEQHEKAEKELKESEDSWWRATKDFFGGGDLLRSSELNKDNLKLVLDQEKKNLESAQEKKLKEETIGTNEYYAKQEEMRKKALKESQEKALKEVGPITINNAEERFKKIDELAKKITGKDFDIQGKMEEVRKKLSTVDFSLMDAKKEEQLLRATDQMQRIHSIFLNVSEVADYVNKAQVSLVKLQDDKVSQDRYLRLQNVITYALLAINMHNPQLIDLGVQRSSKISELFNSTKSISDSISDYVTSTGKYTESLVQTSIMKTQNAVTKMVGAVQTMDDALSKLGTINIGTRLDSVAKSLGIGSSGTYTVQSKEVVINVNFTIQMDAGKVEKAILMNTESIIKDRINFALGGGQGKNEKVAESLMPNMSYTPVATNVK